MVHLSMRVVILLGCVLAVCGLTGSAYPTTYPFDQEATKPPALPSISTTDDFLGKTDDPGGYYGRMLTCNPYADDRLAIKMGHVTKADAAIGFFECKANSHVLYIIYGKVDFVLSKKNCTALTKGQRVFEKFDASFNGASICKDCCKANDGQIGAGPPGGKTQLGKYVDILSKGGCPTFPSSIGEAYVCGSTWLGWSCAAEYFGPPDNLNARPQMKACYDVTWRYYLTCPLFKASNAVLAETWSLERYEPKAYLAKLSTSQTSVLSVVYRFPDRICYPYSYYVPSAATPPASGAQLNSIVTIVVTAVAFFWP